MRTIRSAAFFRSFSGSILELTRQMGSLRFVTRDEPLEKKTDNRDFENQKRPFASFFHVRGIAAARIPRARFADLSSSSYSNAMPSCLMTRSSFFKLRSFCESWLRR